MEIYNVDGLAVINDAPDLEQNLEHKSIAVSYTHLDVYKRQVVAIMNTDNSSLNLNNNGSFNRQEKEINLNGLSAISVKVEA